MTIEVRVALEPESWYKLKKAAKLAEENGIQVPPEEIVRRLIDHHIDKELIWISRQRQVWVSTKS